VLSWVYRRKQCSLKQTKKQLQTKRNKQTKKNNEQVQAPTIYDYAHNASNTSAS